MHKTYQNEQTDTSRPGVPESVSVALAELVEDMREGLLALAVGAGLQVLAAIMEEDVTTVCGPKGRHNPARAATRHGHGAGSVTLGGRGCRCRGRGYARPTAPGNDRWGPTSCTPRRTCLIYGTSGGEYVVVDDVQAR